MAFIKAFKVHCCVYAEASFAPDPLADVTRLSTAGASHTGPV